MGNRILGNRPLITYFAALFLFGLGHAAILPPFEGFDETAHYSAIRQVADTGTLPLRGASFLAQDVISYAGPVQYDSLAPPFDTGLVYRKFFADPANGTNFTAAYRENRQRPEFASSSIPNWQVQHPPLYYVLLAPVLKLTESLSFTSEILILRLLSFTLALCGVAFAVCAFQTKAPNPSSSPVHSNTVGLFLYPIALPMFIPAFARIGNDSLCLLFTGAIACFVARWLADEGKRKWPIATGIALGLGLMTKALFVPVAGALALFFGARAWRSEGQERCLRIRNLATVLAVALPLGAVWYVHHYLIFGEWTGGNEALRLAQSGGLLASLGGSFSVPEVIRGLLTAAATWIWAGSWSLVHPAPFLYAPAVLTVTWLTAAYLHCNRHRAITDPVWLAVYVFAAFGCGLLWHIIISVALEGAALTMGTYLHILLPWAAPAFGLAAASILERPKQRPVLAALVALCVLFQIAVVWAQFALFTGCAWKADDKTYGFPDGAYCLDQIPTLVERLGTTGWPLLAGIGFGGGLISALWLGIDMRRAIATSQRVR